MTRATHGANLKLNTVPALKWAGGIDRRPGWELARGPCECTGGSRMSDRNGDSETHVYTQAASSGLRPGPGSGPAPVARLRVGIGNLNLNLAPLPASVHIALAGPSGLPKPVRRRRRLHRDCNFTAGAGDWGGAPCGGFGSFCSLRVRPFCHWQAAARVLAAGEHAGDSDRTSGFPIDGPLSSALSTKCQCTLRVRGRCIHCVTLACASRTGRGCVQ